MKPWSIYKYDPEIFYIKKENKTFQLFLNTRNGTNVKVDLKNPTSHGYHNG